MTKWLWAAKLTQDEGILIQQALAGEELATRALVDRYSGQLASYLKGQTADDFVVEDLTQETFLRAFASLEKFDASRSFRGWLFGIANHVYVDYLRKRREKPAQSLSNDESLLTRIRGGSPDEAELDETQDKLSCLREALSQMNPEYQAVISARYLQEMPRHEIADLLGISEYNVKMRLYRAKKELVDRYERLRR